VLPFRRLLGASSLKSLVFVLVRQQFGVPSRLPRHTVERALSDYV
jgi:hypothetical protein